MRSPVSLRSCISWIFAVGILTGCTTLTTTFNRMRAGLTNEEPTGESITTARFSYGRYRRSWSYQGNGPDPISVDTRKQRTLTIPEPRCALCELTRCGHPAREQARRLFYLSARSKVAQASCLHHAARRNVIAESDYPRTSLLSIRTHALRPPGKRTGETLILP